jgi:hypothetical protein
MVIRDERHTAIKILDVVAMISFEILKMMWLFTKSFCMGWTTGAILLQKPRHWDPLTKATIFFVGKQVLLGKRRTIKRKRYLK